MLRSPKSFTPAQISLLSSKKLATFWIFLYITRENLCSTCQKLNSLPDPQKWNPNIIFKAKLLCCSLTIFSWKSSVLLSCVKCVLGVTKEYIFAGVLLWLPSKKALSPNWGCGIYLIPQDPSYIMLLYVVDLEGNLKLAFTSLRHCLVWGRDSSCCINFTDPSKYEYLWVMLDFIHSSSTLFYKVLNA